MVQEVLLTQVVPRHHQHLDVQDLHHFLSHPWGQIVSEERQDHPLRPLALGHHEPRLCQDPPEKEKQCLGKRRRQSNTERWKRTDLFMDTEKVIREDTEKVIRESDDYYYYDYYYLTSI